MSAGDGLDLDRPRSVVAILAATWGLYTRHLWLFAALALSVVAPYELLVTALTGQGPLSGHHHLGVGAEIALWILPIALVTPLISALHIHAVAQAGRGDVPRFATAASSGLRVLPVASAVAIVAGIGEFAGFLALVVPGIILLARWAVAVQVAAVERTDWWNALRRSRELARENYVHVLGVILVVAAIGATIDFAAYAIPGSTGASANAVILGIAVSTITHSFEALAGALLYFDLAARHKRKQPRIPAERAYDRPRDLD